MGQSQNAGKDAVKELIQLRETRDGLKKWQHEYDALIEDEDTPVNEYTDAKTKLVLVRSHLRDLTAKIRDKQSALGIADYEKVDAHTAASVKSRKPAISKLAHSYNALCNTMQQLFNKGKAPHGTICPKQLELKGIFDLDVNDIIWEDIGLEEGMPAAPPLWIADEGMRVGIKALLEQDQCLEEEVRLWHECRSMRIWLSEEWCIVNLTLGTDDESLAYHLRLRCSSLLRLCSQWQLSVHSLDFGDITSLPDWGPSVEDILNFCNMQKIALVNDIPRTYTDNTKHDNQLHRDERDEESEYSDSEHGEVDMILIDTIDAVT
ncbi:hypothetical protein DXG01_001306 [Tephrocybe rancida]|nr:hypothetical protein DXG01_001306 [Tephrocybe rancida]